MSKRSGSILKHPVARRAGVVGGLLLIAVGGWFVADSLPQALHNSVRIAAAGCAVAAAFSALIHLVVWMLSCKSRVLGVAAGVIREALHTKVSIVLLILMALILAGLPFIVGQSDRLQYRIQQFLSYSLLLSTFLLALLTIFMACQTLSSEIRDKQIFTVMTKPIHRGSYLLGKWLGIVLLNAVLLTVVGFSIYGFVVFYLVPQPARDALDRWAIEEQVLTARIAADPALPDNLQRIVDERLQRMIDEQSTAFIEDRGGIANMQEQIRQQILTEWRSLGPLHTTGFQALYVFPNMSRAKQMGRTLRLEYKINASAPLQDQIARIQWGAGGYLLGEPKQIPVNIKQTEEIPVELINDDGELHVLAVNWNEGVSISFPAKDGLKLLYVQGEFGPNFVRGMVMVWFKLAFLAALGLAASSFLGFPVAVLLSLLIFTGASLSGFIIESLEYFARPGEDGSIDLLSLLTKWVAMGFTAPLEKYGQFKPVPYLVDGLYISWRALGACALWIGGVWTGVAGVIAWFIFQRRELARVQV